LVGGGWDRVVSGEEAVAGYLVRNERFNLTPMDRDTRFVELRYENGFKRGSTTEGSNALVASFGVQF
jgi:hypothetical protein